jgi:hypothetical protein
MWSIAMLKSRSIAMLSIAIHILHLIHRSDVHREFHPDTSPCRPSRSIPTHRHVIHRNFHLNPSPCYPSQFPSQPIAMLSIAISISTHRNFHLNPSPCYPSRVPSPSIAMMSIAISISLHRPLSPKNSLVSC